ncbi:MAG: peptidoglycan-binding protein [Verrucomicrobiota bacterium]|nr:peptidoglycan-binding protein [Verrucomicrobiota bacterium]
MFCVSVRADEALRQVQEELRKRNLFYGDIDGRESSALTAALKAYQQRKGFPQTGEADATTLRSMSIAASGDDPSLPNVPVLRGDVGVLEGADRDAASLVAMPEPVKGPPATLEEMRTYLRDYLAACETPGAIDDLDYYAPRVEYFHHGAVTRGYIRNQLIAYNQQWPERQYTLTEPVTVKQSGYKTIVQFRLAFTLRNYEQNRAASGQTKNTYTLVRRPDMSWEIVAQKEERVRPATTATARRRGRRPANPVGATMHRVGRTMRKIFR